MSRKQFTYNSTTEVLEHYPDLRRYQGAGVPSAATYSIYSSGTVSLATGAVTLDTASQTLGAHALGATTLTVTSSAAFVVGRRYWLDDGYQGYEVECYSKPLATTLVITEPLRRAITSGSIKGHGLRVTLGTSVTGSLRRHVRVEWSATLTGATYKSTEFVDVVELPFALFVTEADLESADPSFGEQVGSSARWRRWVDGAIEDVWQALEGAGLKPDCVRSRDVLTRPVVYRALAIRHQRDPELAERYKALFEESWAHVISSKDTWYDADDDLVPSDAEDSAPSGSGGWVEVGAGTGNWVRADSPIGATKIGAVQPGEADGLPAARRLKVM